jgi:hypothetical protein
VTYHVLSNEGLRAMGYNARNDEIRDNVTRLRQEWEAQRGAPATVYRIGGLAQSRIEQHKSERRGGKKDRQEGEVDPTQHLRN